MAADWGRLFEKYGVKTVTKADKGKDAYVPNAAQVAAVDAAGIAPQQKREFAITILGDPETRRVGASYYHSLREPDPSRKPEPRMGREFINRWLNEGDRVVIGNIGRQLFAAKDTPDQTNEEMGVEVARTADPKTILALAAKAKGKPAKKAVTRNDFQRNPHVVAAAIVRSNGKCEMPGCTRSLFERDDLTPYLEVHHVVPLSEEGDDSLENAAALCPHCHRELHSGKNKLSLRKTLAKYIKSIS